MRTVSCYYLEQQEIMEVHANKYEKLVEERGEPSFITCPICGKNAVFVSSCPFYRPNNKLEPEPYFRHIKGKCDK